MNLKSFVSTRSISFLIVALVASSIVGLALAGSTGLLPFLSEQVFALDAASASDQNTEEKINAKKSAKPSKRGTSVGKIAFAQGNDLFFMPNRRDHINLVDPIFNAAPTEITTVDDFEPDWSNEGDKIVFVSYRDGPRNPNGGYQDNKYRELYTMNADGSDQRRMYGSSVTAEFQPSFGPTPTSGPPVRKIVFILQNELIIGAAPAGFELDGIHTITEQGTEKTFITDGAECMPDPEEFKRKRKANRAANLIPLHPDLDRPRFNNDGTKILFSMINWDTYYWDINEFDIATSQCRTITSVDSAYGTRPGAVYSPDGTKIAFDNSDRSAEFLSYKLKVASTSTGATLNEYFLDNFRGYPSWSPDGTEIAYVGGEIVLKGTDVYGNQIGKIQYPSGLPDQVYFSGYEHGIRGMSWGQPTSAVIPMTMRVNSPNPIESGKSATVTINLAAPAPAGGRSVSLSLVNMAIETPPIATLPSSTVVVPEGETSVTFTVNTKIKTSRSDYRSFDVLATSTSPTFAQAMVTVSVTPSWPDLRAVSLTAPPVVNLDQGFNIGWTVENIGLVSTFGTYADRIYFSTDDVYDQNDNFMGVLSRPTLAAGASQTATNFGVAVSSAWVPDPGTYYLILIANSNNSVNEGGMIGNNRIAVPIQIAFPDLVVDNLVVPANSEPNVSYPLTFTIRNAGSATTGASSITRIRFSVDSIAGNSDDIDLTSFSTAALAAGATSPQSRNVTIPTLPVQPTGPAFFYVQVDSNSTIYEGTSESPGELNNNAFQPTQFEYRVPDLQVTASGSASDADTDVVFPLSWTTTNAGNKDVTANFNDTVYLSADQTFGGDTALGTFALTGGLAQGASAERIQNVTIPYASIPATGTFYLLIRTDSGTSINEGANENNNIRVHPIYVRKALRPDLVVSNVTAPPTVFFDQTIQVQWTVTNNGSGPTNAPQWRDAVYIGTSSSSTSGATRLAEPLSITALNPGESYTATATVKIPRGISGGYHFLVRANYNGSVNETSTANNLLSRPVTVNVPPLPDLIVDAVNAPGEVFAGQQISINYSIRNIGTEDAGSRKDRIYLSRDTTLNTGQDKLIFTSDNIYGPAAGQVTSHVSQNRVGTQEPPVYNLAHIPSNLEGLWYVFVLTDYQDSVYEYTGENNNTGRDTAEPGSPMNILVTPPDLVVPNMLTTPAIAESGGSIPVEFVVRNQGAFNAAANLYHAVYLSTNATFEPGTDTLLATFKDTAFFGPGTEHTITLNAGIPYCLANGTYYLFAIADFDNRQFEFDPNFDAEANNASPATQITLSTIPPDLQVTNFTVPPINMPGSVVPLTWTVTNSGSSTTRNWIDRVYLHSLTPGVAPQTLGSFSRTGGLVAGGSYTASGNIGLPLYMEGSYFLVVATDTGTSVTECGPAEENNWAQSSNFSVQNNLPDLVVDSVGAPTTATVGDTFNVSWVGRNANQAMPSNSSSFRDSVFLSSDTTLSNNDIGIGTALNNLILGAGQTYPQQANVSIGNVTPGTYYILVATDSNRNIYEGTSGSGFESNNVRASAPITLSAPAVDLTVGSITMSSPRHSGTFRDFSWTVTNVGTSPTLASSWTDYVILSRDSILDPSDTTLGYRTRTGVLAGGANYVANASYFIPVGLTGDYTIFVITDRNDSVVESNNANNTATPLPINLTLPPPAELSITNITPPATASVGGTAVFNWTVQNTGANAINGIWRDTFYFSRDQFWDASDTLIGVRDLDSQTTSVPASGGTYTATWGGALPPVDEGTYYVIVRTDAQNRIRESNEANNVATSVSTTTITVTQLTLNTPFNTTLGNGAQMFFKYATDPAETLLFTLATDTPQRSNEVFTKFDTMVSRADYDVQSTRPNEGNQENVIDPTQDGDYYTMVRTDLIPESFASSFDKKPADAKSSLGGSVPDQNITVEAKILPFSVRKVTPEVAGNSGYSTLAISGAKFQTGATVKLVHQSGSELVPMNTRVETSKILAIFDLKGRAAGEYDIVVRNPNNQTATLEDNFTIVNGGGAAEPRVAIDGPGFARGGRIRYTFSFANDGLNDLYLVPLIITMPSSYQYELDRSNYIGDLEETLPPDAVPSQLPLHIERDGMRMVMLVAPILGSGRTVKVNLDITLPFGFSGFDVTAMTLPPLADWYQMSQVEQTNLLERRTAALGSGTEEACLRARTNCLLELLRSVLFTVLMETLPGNCVNLIWSQLGAGLDFMFGLVSKAASGSDINIYDKVGSVSSLIASLLSGYATECLSIGLPWIKLVSQGLATLKAIYDFYECFRAYYECLPPPPEKLRTSFLTSFDPNEKIGPLGYGGERFVPVNTPLQYRINFENLATADVPAQLVRITDSLPPSLDLRTVRLKEIGFKQNRYVMPENQSFYQARVQLGEDLGNLKADILAGVDLVNNRVFWNIQAIDPNTGEPPLDPFAGLLPPNNTNRDGEGYVIFTVEAKSSFPNRTLINNSATIIFDQNEPIITNVTENMLDSVVPVSQMSPLSPTTSSPEFEVNWAGSDDADGSGFAGHSIMYSENNGPFLLYINSLTETSTTFVGNWGKTYRFYSTGRDNAGNVERAPAQPDATIRVLGGDTEGDVSPRPNGSDGTLNGDDLTQVRRFIAKLDSAMQYNELQRADMAPKTESGDGSLTVADIMQARRYVAGTDPRAEASGPNVESFGRGKTIAGKNAGLLPREVKPIKIIRHGANQIEVGIVLETQGDETGLGFGLNFDPAVLSNPVVSLRPIASGGTLTLNTAQVATGKLGVLLDKAPNQPFVAGSNVLMTIMFDIALGSPATTQITFDDDPIKREVVNGVAEGLTTTFSPGTIQLLGPTSSNVSVSGRVTNINGMPIRGARVTVSGNTSQRMTASSNAFGYFRIDGVPAGATYTLSVQARGYTFSSRIITVTDSIDDLVLMPEP